MAHLADSFLGVEDPVTVLNNQETMRYFFETHPLNGNKYIHLETTEGRDLGCESILPRGSGKRSL